MRAFRCSLIAALLLSATSPLSGQNPLTLVAVFAHPDDEGAAAPILARYAREGARVFLVIVTDGSQGASNTTLQPGPELALERAKEARCAADALGIQPPIVLDFPDGGLGNYAADRALLYRLTQRLHRELEQLRPDAIITWGPDGGTGHPDHRLVGAIVTQLVRAGAPGIPERLFFAGFSEEAMRAMNPDRGAPPLLVPQTRHLSARIAFESADFDAAARSMACHRTQYTEEQVARSTQAARSSLNGIILLAPAFTTDGESSIFAATR